MVATLNLGDDRFRNMTPYHFSGLLDSSRINPDNAYYWWRGISGAYLTRPNANTRKLIHDHGMPGLPDLNGQCVSMYVRHGDKGKEMHLVPFRAYATAAAEIWAQMRHSRPPPRERDNVTGKHKGRILVCVPESTQFFNIFIRIEN